MSDSFLNAASSGFTKFCLLMATVVAANVLSKQEFGELASLRLFSALVVVISSLSMNVLVTSEMARSESKSRVYSTGLTLSILSAVAMCFVLGMFYESINTVIFDGEFKKTPYLLSIGLSLLEVISLFLMGSIYGMGQYKVVYTTLFVAAPAYIIAPAILTHSYGVSGFLVGQACCVFIVSLVFFKKITALLYFGKSRVAIFDLGWAIVFLKKTIPLYLSSLLVIPLNFLSIYLIMRFSSLGLEEVATFSAADQLFIIFGVVGNAFFQKIIYMSSKGEVDIDRFNSIRIYTFFAIFLSLSMAVLFLASKFVTYLWGDNYANDEDVFLIALYAGLAFFVQIPMSNYLIGMGEYKTLFKINACWATLFLTGLLAVYLADLISASSVYIVKLSSYLVLLAVTIFFFYRKVFCK